MAETARPVLQKPPGYRDPAPPPSAAPRAPPRKPQLPPTFRNTGKPIHHDDRRCHHHRRRSVCCRLWCCFFLLLFSLLFLLAIAGALSYLYFQPRLPSFRLQSLQSPQFNISDNNKNGGTFLDAVTVVKIFASNPNGKIALSYGSSKAEMYVADGDGDVPVGSGSISGFVQGRRNATVLKFSAAAKGVLVDEAVASRLRARFRSKEIRFGVEVRTRVGLRASGRSTGRMPIRVVCRPVSLRMAKAGTALPKCDIKFLRWIIYTDKNGWRKITNSV